MLDAFMQQYDLSSEEGVVLMCLAEALLRIPDGETAEKLIADKLGDANWESHLGKSSSVLVNASTWALMIMSQSPLTHASYWRASVHCCAFGAWNKSCVSVTASWRPSTPSIKLLLPVWTHTRFWPAPCVVSRRLLTYKRVF